MKKGEVPLEQHTIADVARDTRRRAAYLLKKPFVEQREVYALAKEFFKAYLKKPQEFTCDELKRELHKIYLNSAVRDRVDALIDKLSLLEYTDTQYSQTEIKLLTQELDGIVKDLFIEHSRRLPFLTRVANWLFRKEPKSNETIISDYPMLEPNDPVSIELNTILEDIYLAIEKNNIRKAAKYYKYLMKRYDTLGPSAQQEFYHKIQAAYEAIAKQTA
ncbi:hypothetical protein GOV07_01240 [Candidatus Woesearchaeota archaeon]|nr:hypothetical protein [Candidatus Woesearchaeota archaeon]